MTMTRRPAQSLPGLAVRQDGPRGVSRALPEEWPVALVYDGTTQAVMMASPADLEDFALGFSLSEGIVTHPGQLEGPEIVEHATGTEARFWLAPERAEALKARRRSMTGPVGCGLCGIDSLDQAIRPLPRVASALRLAQSDVARAAEALGAHQPLHDQTRAVHAAGFLRPGAGIVLAREDVGRHNALDKLIGAMARKGIDPAQGAIVMTSRISVELVQKCAIAGCPVLVAVSAPTAHAVRLAEGAGVTLAAFARSGAFDLYAHPDRILTGASDVA